MLWEWSFKIAYFEPVGSVGSCSHPPKPRFFNHVIRPPCTIKSYGWLHKYFSSKKPEWKCETLRSKIMHETTLFNEENNIRVHHFSIEYLVHKPTLKNWESLQNNSYCFLYKYLCVLTKCSQTSFPPEIHYNAV